MSDPTEERIRQALIGGLEKREIVLLDYDPAWAERYAVEAARIRGALAERVLLLEHVGSTSVPGLAAKPIVDVLLVVADSAAEDDYVPVLERAGYVLRVREPDWHEHRMLRTPELDVHVHVFSPGSTEIDRLLMLRERLRTHAEERELYASTKRELARRDWPTMQHYADAKTDVVEAILARAGAPGPS